MFGTSKSDFAGSGYALSKVLFGGKRSFSNRRARFVNGSQECRPNDRPIQFFLVWAIPVSRLLWWTSLNFWSHPLICLANAQLTAWRATKTHEEQPSERFKLLVFRRLETSRHHSNWSSSSKCSSPSQILWPFDYSPTQLSKWTSSSPTGFHDQRRSVFNLQMVIPCRLPEGS